MHQGIVGFSQIWVLEDDIAIQIGIGITTERLKQSRWAIKTSE